MNLLLDTHILLWFLASTNQLPKDWTKPESRIWNNAALTMDFALTELEILLSSSLKSQAHQQLEQWLNRAIAKFLQIPDNHYLLKDYGGYEILHILFVERPNRYFIERGTNPLKWIEYIDHHFPYWIMPRNLEQETNYRDRFAPMFTLPLPKYKYPEIENIQNVGQLLVSFVSSPGKFANANNATLEIIQFAAALLGARVVDRNNNPDWRTRSAHCWLSQSLPRWVFPDQLEKIIQSTK